MGTSQNPFDNSSELMAVTQCLADLCEKVCALSDSHSVLSISHASNGGRMLCSEDNNEKPIVLNMEVPSNCYSANFKCTLLNNSGTNNAMPGDVVIHVHSPMKDQSNLVGGHNVHQSQDNNHQEVCGTDVEKLLESRINFDKTMNQNGKCVSAESNCNGKDAGVESCTEINEKNLTENNMTGFENTLHLSESDNICRKNDESALRSVQCLLPCATGLNSNMVKSDQTQNTRVSIENTCFLNKNGNSNDFNTSVLAQGKNVSKNSVSGSKSQSALVKGSVVTCGDDIDDFEFVLSIVKEDFEQIQMINKAAVVVSQAEDMQQDSVKRKSDLSETDTSSCSSSSESSSDETSSDSEDNGGKSIELRNLIEKEEEKRTPGPPKTKGELLLSELPPPEPLDISANEELEIKPLGEIESILGAEAVVIIKSLDDVPAVDSESILFLEDGSAFGQVFEIFGQVRCPHYCVRFNNEEEVKQKKISVGQTVYYAPNTATLTHFVFVSKLQSMKGSDASWKHDLEPPEEILEYSDDEAEARAKAAKRKANRLKKQDQTQDREKAPSEPSINVKQTTSKSKPNHSQSSLNQQPGSQPIQQPQLLQPFWPPHQAHQAAFSRPLNSLPVHPPEFHGGRFPVQDQTPRHGVQPMEYSLSRLSYHPHQGFSHIPPSALPGAKPVRQSQTPTQRPLLPRQPCPPLPPRQQCPPLLPRQPPLQHPPQFIGCHDYKAPQNVDCRFQTGQQQCQTFIPHNVFQSPQNVQPPNLQVINQGQFTTRPRWPAVHLHGQPQRQPWVPENRQFLPYPPQ